MVNANKTLKTLKLLSLGLLIGIAGCAGQFKYAPPATPAAFTNSKEIAKGRDDVWNTLVPALVHQHATFET